MSFIGIDLGASFLKGAWLHPEQRKLGPVHREAFPGFQAGLPPKWREVACEDILAAVERLIERLIGAHGEPCAGLLLCGQMHGLFLAHEDGTAASNFISWQDSRCREIPAGGGASHYEVARAKLGPGLIAELGNEFRLGLPVATLFAMAQTGQLTPNTAPLALADFVAMRLTGCAPVTDATNAAAHGLLSVATRKWHTEALSALGLTGLRLPRIQTPFDPVGYCRLGHQEFPVYTPIGDQQAALLGAGLVLGEVSLNIATGSQVSAIVKTSEPGDWQLRPYPDGTWLRTVTHLPAGRALNPLIHLCSELAAAQGTPVQDPWGQIARLAELADPRDLTANLCFFPTPLGERGAITEIREDEISVGHLFRAAFRSMAENYALAARQVAGAGWSRLVFSGGLVQKLPVLQGEILQRLGSAHRFAAHSEDTLMGLLGMSARIAA